MTIDDIYYAARDGNLPLLSSQLEEGSVDLNAMLEGGMQNGYDVTLPMLFTLLEYMSVNDLNRPVLDLLVAHGIDLNARVVLKNDQTVTRVPLLTYPIQIWHNEEIVAYLLEKGANPGAVKEILNRSNGHVSTSPMAYFAISAPHGERVLELLLEHGADPNQYADVYDERGFYQYLPLIYYATVEQQSLNKCTLLFRYGASPQVMLDLGKGPVRKPNFQQYLRMTYPNLTGLMNRAFEQAQAAGAVRRTAVVQQAPADMLTPHDQQREQGRPKSIAPKVTSLRRCYGKFSAYLFGNFGVLALALMIIAPLIYLGSDPEMAGIWFVMGLFPAAIALLVWLYVQGKAKRAGQSGVMGQFILDSLLMFAKVLLMMCIVFIPLAMAIGSNIQWEDRTTTGGSAVRVRSVGNGEYEDAGGKRYHE